MNGKSTLLEYKKNINSQNGDDGIIARIFEIIGDGERVCCEFGAWDGIYLSNCRELIQKGWTGVMIEGDLNRYKTLVENYSDNDDVHCVNCFVDTKDNRVKDICKRAGFDEIDFLSIDIDGLDYNLFADLGFNPRVICVEVNAGHSPYSEELVKDDIAQHNVGQPLRLFENTAKKNGYALVAYNGNAYFVRDELVGGSMLKLSAEEAYIDYLKYLDQEAREWLWLVNIGVVSPRFRYDNQFLTRSALNISVFRACEILLKISRKIGWLQLFDLLRGSFRLMIEQKKGPVLQ